eukprot:COSAG01_NODE_17794_length_1123_cov_141.639648_2_plen_160_part_00
MVASDEQPSEHQQPSAGKANRPDPTQVRVHVGASRRQEDAEEGAHRMLQRDAPVRAFPSSIFQDKNRGDIGKSQPKWTTSMMETPGARAGVARVAALGVQRGDGGGGHGAGEADRHQHRVDLQQPAAPPEREGGGGHGVDEDPAPHGRELVRAVQARCI